MYCLDFDDFLENDSRVYYANNYLLNIFSAEAQWSYEGNWANNRTPNKVFNESLAQLAFGTNTLTFTHIFL